MYQCKYVLSVTMLLGCASTPVVKPIDQEKVAQAMACSLHAVTLLTDLADIAQDPKLTDAEKVTHSLSRSATEAVWQARCYLPLTVPPCVPQIAGRALLSGKRFCP